MRMTVWNISKDFEGDEIAHTERIQRDLKIRVLVENGVPLTPEGRELAKRKNANPLKEADKDYWRSRIEWGGA
jgi:hypothetical protein